MKHLFCVMLLIGIFAFVGSPVVSAQTQCLVADPTGTMLNVRSSPNGRIVARLRNGTAVQLESGDETWAKIRIRRNGRWVILGWVYFQYLDCH